MHRPCACHHSNRHACLVHAAWTCPGHFGDICFMVASHLLEKAAHYAYKMHPINFPKMHPRKPQNAHLQRVPAEQQVRLGQRARLGPVPLHEGHLRLVPVRLPQRAHVLAQARESVMTSSASANRCNSMHAWQQPVGGIRSGQLRQQQFGQCACMAASPVTVRPLLGRTEQFVIQESASASQNVRSLLFRVRL